MPIISSDVKIFNSGGAGNSNPNASLGGAISATEITDNTLHNLFDKVSGAESDAGDTEYRCFYVKNTHATLTYQGVVVYIDTNTPSADTSVEISVATETGSPVQTIGNESTAPNTQSFSTAAGAGNALTIGDLAAGASKAVWVKRIVTAGAAAYASDSVVIKFSGDTDA